MFIKKHPKIRKLTTAGAAIAVLAFPVGAQADSPTTLEAKLIPPSMVKTFGGKIPRKGTGAVIEVYGGKNRYEGIANLTKKTSLRWRVEAKAPLGRVLDESWIKIGDKGWTAYRYSDKAYRGHGPRTLVTDIRVSELDIGMNPVAACNAELAVRAAKTKKSKQSILKQGFVLKVDDAIRGEVKMRWLRVVKKPRTVAKSISAPVYISCMGDLSAGKTPGKKPSPTGPLPEPRTSVSTVGPWLKASMEPVTNVSGNTLNKTNLYGRNCPLQARFQASVRSKRPVTTVRYRYVGEDWKSPVKSTLLKKGLQKLPAYVKQVGKAKSGTMKLKGEAGKPDYSGWAMVEILQNGDNIASKKRPYRVYCSEKPKRAPSKPKPTTFMPGKITTPQSDPRQPKKPEIKEMKLRDRPDRCEQEGDGAPCPKG